MTNSADAERRILSSAVEDYTGLWELLWELSTARSGGVSNADRALAETALRSLLDRGWVALYRGREFAGEEQPVPAMEFDSVLAQDESWSEPAKGAIQVRVAATQAGEDEFRRT